jgi:hypothetical protein
MNRTIITVIGVLAIAGAVGYWYYKKLLPDFIPVTEDDADTMREITLT